MKLFLTILFIAIASASWAKPKASKPPDRAVMHNNKGVTELYEGDTDRAIFELKTATELAPDYVEGWNNLGLAYKYKGQMEMAIQALTKAISLDKKYASPYNHLGAVYYNLGQHELALQNFLKAVKLNAQFSDAYYNMGLTYIALADSTKSNEYLNKAADTLKKATDINSEHPYAHNELAKVYQRLGRYEQAIIRYKLALEINPKLNDAWVNLSTLYTQTGEALKAQQALNHALSESPESADAHMSMGLSFLSEKNYQLALKEFDKVIVNNPSNELAYYNAGFAHFNVAMTAKNSGQKAKADTAFNQAAKAFESAFTLKPVFADAAYNVGYTHQMNEDLESAQTWYQQTLQADPNHARALYALGEILLGKGDKSGANQNFCRLLKINTHDLGVSVLTIKAKTSSLGGCR